MDPDIKFENYNDAVKHIRRDMRRYRLDSIFDVGLTHLNRPPTADTVTTLQGRDWLVALVLKIALEDRISDRDRTVYCTPSTFAKWVNVLVDFTSAAHGSTLTCSQLFLKARAMLQAQIDFQQWHICSLYRWPMLIAREPVNGPLRTLFKQEFGASPERFSLVITFIYARLRETNGQFILDVNNEFPPFLRADAAIVINSLSRTFMELKDFVRADAKKSRRLEGTVREASERNATAWVSQFPLLRLSKNRFAPWGRFLTFHGISRIAHGRLSTKRQEYTQKFSAIFEQYVLELVKDAGVEAVYEEHYKKLGNKAMNAVEALLPSVSGNVMIEAKMSIFDDRLTVSERPGIIIRRLKRIREAILQAWEVGEQLRINSSSGGAPANLDTDFLIIVTSRQLILCNGVTIIDAIEENYFSKMLASKEPALRARYLRRLPPARINILSIEEFEMLTALVRDGKTTFLDFVKDMEKRFSDPDKSQRVMTAEQVLAVLATSQDDAYSSRALADYQMKLAKDMEKHGESYLW